MSYNETIVNSSAAEEIRDTAMNYVLQAVGNIPLSNSKPL
jgi:hypothetical protein